MLCTSYVLQVISYCTLVHYFIGDKLLLGEMLLKSLTSLINLLKLLLLDEFTRNIFLFQGHLNYHHIKMALRSTNKTSEIKEKGNLVLGHPEY